MIFVDENLDVDAFVQNYLASRFTNSAISRVYDYMNRNPQGNYDHVVGLWNEAGRELSDLFGRPGVERNDQAIRKLFTYMNLNQRGRFERVVVLSQPAGKEIAAAVAQLQKANDVVERLIGT